MTDISLNILDIANNSTKAGATLIEVIVNIETECDKLKIIIRDNGKGMSSDFLLKVTDPFSTTRTTRKVGMGIPLFKMEAEMAGGEFQIQSELNKGTTVTADFSISHIDRPPLGALEESIVTLIGGAAEIDFVFEYSLDGCLYQFDTRKVKNVLEVDKLNETYILSYIQEMIKENIEKINGGIIL